MVAALDGWVEPIDAAELSRELDVPSMFIRSDPWRELENDQVLRGLVERSNRRTYWIGIENIVHSDFTVGPAVSPLAAGSAYGGRCPPLRSLPSWTATWWGFFDRHLLGWGVGI